MRAARACVRVVSLASSARSGGWDRQKDWRSNVCECQGPCGGLELHGSRMGCGVASEFCSSLCECRGLGHRRGALARVSMSLGFVCGSRSRARGMHACAQASQFWGACVVQIVVGRVSGTVACRDGGCCFLWRALGRDLGADAASFVAVLQMLLHFQQDITIILQPVLFTANSTKSAFTSLSPPSTYQNSSIVFCTFLVLII